MAYIAVETPLELLDEVVKDLRLSSRHTRRRTPDVPGLRFNVFRDGTVTSAELRAVPDQID